MNIPQVIKNKIVGEANWRSTNGHGGVNDITRDNFIQAAEFGYLLSEQTSESVEKDFIIAGIAEGSEQWKAEYDNCRAMLQELVDLKNISDTGVTLDYLKRKPKAWEAAKEFLLKYQHC